MSQTYIPIATTTLTTSAADVTFSSISGSYTDLVVIMNILTSVDGTAAQFQFNSDTGSNYSNTLMEGSGSTATSSKQSSQADIQFSFNVGGNSTNPQPIVAHINSYSNTTTNKTVLGRYNSASGGTYPGVGSVVGLWRNTSAITAIKIFPGSGNFNSGSNFTLYGIKEE